MTEVVRLGCGCRLAFSDDGDLVEQHACRSCDQLPGAHLLGLPVELLDQVDDDWRHQLRGRPVQGQP